MAARSKTFLAEKPDSLRNYEASLPKTF